MSANAEALKQVCHGGSNYLFYATWQATIVILLALRLVRVRRRISSHLRYAILLVALAKLIVPPFLSAPLGLNAIFITSDVPLFRDDISEENTAALGGPFDSFQPNILNKITPGGSFNDVDFGEVMLTGLVAEDFLDNFLTNRWFQGDQPTVLDGPFDSFGSNKLFKSLIGGSFGDLNFGNVLPAGLAEADLLTDLSAEGSLAAGGGLGPVDLIYLPVPEPNAVVSLLFGGLTVLMNPRYLSICNF